MSFELKLGAKKKIKVVIDGAEHFARVPTCEEAENFEDELDQVTKTPGVTGKQIMGVMRKYLADLGIPEEVTKKLDSLDFQELIAYVNSPKKN